MNNRRVVITGLGVISSIGIGREEFWDNLLKGKSGISPVSSFDTSNHFTHNGGEVKNFRPEEFIPRDKLPSLSRASQFAFAAAKLAVEDARLSPDDISNSLIGTCIGTTMGSVQTVEIIDELIVIHMKSDLDEELLSQVPTHSAPSAVAKEFGFQGPNMMFATACAAGNYAIGYGFDLIRFGRTDIVIAGGSEPLSKVAFTGFNQFSAVAPEKCQPFDRNRKGMMVAEGAGILVLESLDSALKRKAPIYAEILGYGLSCDAFHMTTSSVEGIAACMRKAMQEANIRIDAIDYISAHGTGTSANDRAECAAIREVFGYRHKQIPISSIKSMLGHTMGAASALEAITCALVVKNNIIPPTINFETPDPECDIDCVPNMSRIHNVNIALNNSYAFGGNNASLVLKKFIQ
ncbi:MAG TPA: beta-ketoacyl-[acyl-carrier-protein] synthase family protein [Thermodesulfovibrionales bacterium]|nr:beta-ketoacyl-[acyl-carrier-protein] synthase family protein [Thermodesulfovibrionales bacterium]